MEPSPSHTAPRPYRGRIAPTPTGHLHLGHAHTFTIAHRRCRQAAGTLIYRDEDLDPARCKPEFSQAAMEDLRWLGLDWDEGPDIGGPHAPYYQSQRLSRYLQAWHRLKDSGHIYPCTRSRRELQAATPQQPTPDELLWERIQAPHEDPQHREPIFPTEWRPTPGTGHDASAPGPQNWRFRVPDGTTIAFHDLALGPQGYTAGQHFGDFLIWRRDGVPAYELAVVVDDIAMGITEVVRGQDLLLSTARQLLIYQALGHTRPPTFYHCPLILDSQGQRLAKRHDSLSLRTLRTQGKTTKDILSQIPTKG